MGVLGRLYNDYVMPGRWEHYRAFLTAAQAHGYQFACHKDARSLLADPPAKLFFLRHDIDSDVPLTRRMFAIERDLGIRSTYYFRRCTLDGPLMREIHAFGSEVGYHYEEVADCIKAKGLRSRDEALACLDTARTAFLAHLRAFEQLLGAKVRSVAAHGDFANRYLGLPNQALMDDALRAAAGLEMEAYDSFLAERVSFRGRDALYPGLWSPTPIIQAIERDLPVILVLAHPRHWQRAPLVRLRLDAGRVWDELAYRLR